MKVFVLLMPSVRIMREVSHVPAILVFLAMDPFVLVSRDNTYF